MTACCCWPKTIVCLMHCHGEIVQFFSFLGQGVSFSHSHLKTSQQKLEFTDWSTGTYSWCTIPLMSQAAITMLLTLLFNG